MLDEWENIRTGVYVWACEENLGPDLGYRVQLVRDASPMWYEKYLFESYYKKVNKDANADISN